MFNKYKNKTMYDDNILNYMHEEKIKVTRTNYKLQLLAFIAENYLNDLCINEYLDEAVNVLLDDNYIKYKNENNIL